MQSMVMTIKANCCSPKKKNERRIYIDATMHLNAIFELELCLKPVSITFKAKRDKVSQRPRDIKSEKQKSLFQFPKLKKGNSTHTRVNH